MQVKLFRNIILVTGFIIYALQFHSLIFEKPAINYAIYFPKTVATYSGKNTYRIKEVNYSKSNSTFRIFSLFRDGPLTFLETKGDKYTLKTGYEKAKISFKWNLSGNVTIIGDNDTLWSLKQLR